MYIRIQDQAIRFRVSKDEAEKIIAGEVLSSSIALSINVKLIYLIQIIDGENQFKYEERNNEIHISVNREKLVNELFNGPSKKGIVFNHAIAKQTISVSLEINVKKIR